MSVVVLPPWWWGAAAERPPEASIPPGAQDQSRPSASKKAATELEAGDKGSRGNLPCSVPAPFLPRQIPAQAGQADVVGAASPCRNPAEIEKFEAKTR